MPTRTITIYHLELAAREEFRPTPNRGPELFLMQAKRPSPEFSRFLYTAIGGDWYWIDRLPWNHARWQADIGRPAVETWVAYCEGTPAGYYQLERCAEGVVDIAYFGLMPFMTGQGSGGYLLSCAVERAYAMGAERVTVNTCTLDHEAALTNYRARGFRCVREERFEKTIPAHSPGPWPQAYSAQRNR